MDSGTPAPSMGWDTGSASAAGGAELDAYIKSLLSTPTPGQAAAGEGGREGGAAGKLDQQTSSHLTVNRAA